MNPINQIVQGDCVQLLKSLPDAGVDLVVTDPPYLVNYRDRSGRTVRNDSGNPEFLNAVIGFAGRPGLPFASK
jgi:DNA modification methylase